MKRKISILFAICLLCALASGCSGEKSVSKVELPAVVPESPAQESVTPESTAQDLPEQNNSAPSQADVELDVPDAPEGKTTLVLGGIGLRDDTLASLVNNFNAENTKYTVVIDDYAENTQSREQAETVMQTKLFAGDAADIYYFRNDMLSPLPWISAGLLYDLDPLIASDSEISEEDIIPWTAMHEYGGLYLLSPTFGVVALSCSQQTQKLHTGWTITEYLDIEKSLRPEQDMIYYMDPENFLKRIGGRYLRGVIDYEHAQCNLDTPEFREILQSALKAGSYDGGYNPDKNVPQRIVDGELICCYVGLSSALEVSFDRYRCGQTLGYVGWPTPAVRFCSRNITLFPNLKNLSAHHTSKQCPPERNQHQHDILQSRAKDSYNGQANQGGWEGTYNIHHAHDDSVDHTALVSGNHAKWNANDQDSC